MEPERSPVHGSSPPGGARSTAQHPTTPAGGGTRPLQRRSPRLEAESENRLRLRIEREEMERLRAEPEEMERLRAKSEDRIRAEVRARLLGELAGRGSTPGSSSRAQDDIDEVEDLRIRIARLEGEQRIEATARREGELEVARLELRNIRRRLR